jgi:hypothetical protein
MADPIEQTPLFLRGADLASIRLPTVKFQNSYKCRRAHFGGESVASAV